MTKDTPSSEADALSADAPVAPPPPASHQGATSVESALPLDTFVLTYAKLAEVETMGAFRKTEQVAARLFDTVTAYSARLSAFMKQQL